MENFIKLKKERKEEKKIIAEILRLKYIVNYLLNIFRNGWSIANIFQINSKI